MKTTKTKLSALAALLAVVIGVSACGSGSSTKSTADNEIAQAANALKEEMGDKDFNEAASAIKDELAKDEAKETTAAEEETIKEIVPTDEILNADMYSGKLQLGNTVFTFPISAKEFFESGAVLSDGKDPAARVISKGYFSDIKFDVDGYTFQKTIHNYDKNENKFLTDLDIDDVPIKENVICPGGIRIGSTIAELDEKWGEPQIDELNSRKYIKDYVYINYFGDYVNVSGCSYTVFLDLDNGVVSGIMRDIREDTDELIEIEENTLRAGKVKYSIPKRLTDRNMMFEYNGKKYVLGFSTGYVKDDKRPDIGEFTDSSVTDYLNSFSYDDGEYLYDYKLNGSELVLVESLNHKNYAEINAAKYTDDDRYCYLNFYVYSCDDEELTADVIKSQNELIFAVAESLEKIPE